METAKENFAKALLIWQNIVDQLPESDHAPHAHYFVAVCYKQLKQFTLSVEYYKIVVDRWPDFTWFVPYRIGVLYRNLKNMMKRLSGSSSNESFIRINGRQQELCFTRE